MVTLNRKEQKRLMVLNQVEKKELDLPRAATLLELSERQVWRILAAYRKEEAAAMAHGNRGRQPANTLDNSIKLKIIWCGLERPDNNIVVKNSHENKN